MCVPSIVLCLCVLLCSDSECAAFVPPQPKNRAFVWNGVNYLLTLPSSMDFMDRSSDLIKWFGFRLERNPFLVPAYGTSETMLPMPARDNMEGVDMMLLREMEQMIVAEERDFGMRDTMELCSWCSIDTNKHTRYAVSPCPALLTATFDPAPRCVLISTMCRPCREYYCYDCVRGNLGTEGETEAKKSSAWVCFVCSWDERQRLARVRVHPSASVLLCGADLALIPRRFRRTLSKSTAASCTNPFMRPKCGRRLNAG